MNPNPRLPVLTALFAATCSLAFAAAPETPTAKVSLFNGKEVNKATSANPTSGFIGLQSEGGAFEVKQATIEPLFSMINTQSIPQHLAASRRRSPDHQLIEKPERADRNPETDRTHPCLRVARFSRPHVAAITGRREFHCSSGRSAK